MIDENEMHLLAMNECNRVVLSDEQMGIPNNIMSGPDFNIPSLAFNYIYRPKDQAVLDKYPHLRFLPTEEEAKAVK